ncbi:hypothetical protein CsSME_00016418 [Camellia sinensis var. sinensis]
MEVCRGRRVVVEKNGRKVWDFDEFANRIVYKIEIYSLDNFVWHIATCQRAGFMVMMDPMGGQRRGGALGRTRSGGNGGHGFGRGRGRGRGCGEKLLAADLDADLEKYHSEAMQIN